MNYVTSQETANRAFSTALKNPDVQFVVFIDHRIPFSISMTKTKYTQANSRYLDVDVTLTK